MSDGAQVLTADAPVVTSTQNGAANITTVPDWRASLPEDLRADKSFEAFKDLPSLAKSYIETKRMVGDAIRPPKDGAPKEEYDKFYAKLGRPESPDKYEITRPDLPEGAPYDEGAEKEYRNWAHEVGLNNKQAQTIFDKYNTFQQGKVEAFMKEQQTGLESLKKEWGSEADKNIGFAKRAVAEIGGEDIKNLLRETGLGNHPVLVKFFANLGEQMAEAELTRGSDAVSAGGAEAIQAKIDAIRNDPNHAFHGGKGITDQARLRATAEMTKLYEQLAIARGETNNAD